jgi:hypothetical protein
MRREVYELKSDQRASGLRGSEGRTVAVELQHDCKNHSLPCRFRAALVCKKFLHVLTCPDLAGLLWAADLEFSGSVLAAGTPARLDSFVLWLQRVARGLTKLKLAFTYSAAAAEGADGALDDVLLREGIGSE